MHPSRWYKAYYFDVDGTLALGDQIIPGVNECLQELRAKKVIVRVLSNDSTSDREGHVRRLAKAGVHVEADEVLTTIEATVSWLAFHYPDAVVYPIGAPQLSEGLTRHGIKISDDPKEVDIVIASSDHHLEFKKLQIAFTALYQYKRAFLIATNPDRHGPLPGGGGVPDTGAIMAALERSANVKCQEIIGKPNPHLLLSSLADVRVPPEDALMVGDTLETDIAVAHNAGTASALTLTGDSDIQDVVALGPKLRPTWVVDNLTQLIPQS